MSSLSQLFVRDSAGGAAGKEADPALFGEGRVGERGELSGSSAREYSGVEEVVVVLYVSLLANYLDRRCGSTRQLKRTLWGPQIFSSQSLLLPEYDLDVLLRSTAFVLDRGEVEVVKVDCRSLFARKYTDR